MKRFVLTAMIALTAAPALACPFCEIGSLNVMKTVAIVFGLFMLGMIAIGMAFFKSGAAKTSSHPEMSVLDAEGIIPSKGEKDAETDNRQS